MFQPDVPQAQYNGGLDRSHLKERARALLQAIDYVGHGGKVMIERTHHSCLTFSQVLYQRGFISHAQWGIIKGLYDQLEEVLPNPDTLVVLDTSPEICYSRMAKRARPCEKRVLFSYLEDIYKLIWVQADRMPLKGTEVIRLDWSELSDRGGLNERLRSVRTWFLGSMAVIISYGKVRRGVYVKDIRRDVDQILGFR